MRSRAVSAVRISEYRSARAVQTRRIAEASSSSDASPRMSERRSVPWVANRQVKSWPSADRRARVQSRQKAWVTDEMKPTSPLPSR